MKVSWLIITWVAELILCLRRLGRDAHVRNANFQIANILKNVFGDVKQRGYYDK